MEERQLQLRKKAISHPIRSKILDELDSGTHSILALRDKLDIDLRILIQHLTILKRCKLITFNKHYVH